MLEAWLAGHEPLGGNWIGQQFRGLAVAAIELKYSIRTATGRYVYMLNNTALPSSRISSPFGKLSDGGREGRGSGGPTEICREESDRIEFSVIPLKNGTQVYLSEDSRTFARHDKSEGDIQKRLMKKNSEHLRTWVEIDAQAAKKNIETFRKIIGKNVRLWAVVKSNAYGHGLYAFSGLMDRFGIDGLCVDSVVEGLALRRMGIKKYILVLGPTLPARFARRQRTRS